MLVLTLKFLRVDSNECAEHKTSLAVDHTNQSAILATEEIDAIMRQEGLLPQNEREDSSDKVIQRWEANLRPLLNI